MHYLTFGRVGWAVSEVGYGMWGMAGWTGSDDEESLASLDYAVALAASFNGLLPLRAAAQNAARPAGV